jgi:zinc D-Ala-D-Ala carboxypeptidase
MATPLDEKLSPHFTWGEMTRTGQSSLQEVNRQEAEKVKAAITALCKTLMEPIREKFGPLRINSCFRGPAVNSAVGGSKSSQHMVGEAADFVPLNDKIALMTVVDWVRKESGLKWGQLINEHPGNSKWIHISLGDPWRKSNNMQVLDYDGKAYTPIK